MKPTEHAESDVTYRREGQVALITMDDGKVNALSPAMIRAVGGALNRAEEEGLPVVFAGRPGVFSGGFDLRVMRAGGLDALRMIRRGFLLAARLLAFPHPVVVACTGHAVAMGVFLVLSGDERIGAAGDFRLVANEVAIGMTLPRAAVAICRQRLAPAAFERATLLAEPFGPSEAVAAGFLDRVVDEGEVVATALERGQRLAQLDMRAHRETKRRVRQPTLDAIHRGLVSDVAELGWMGARQLAARSPLARRQAKAG